LDKAKNMITAATNIKKQLQDIPEIQLISVHDTTVVSFTSKLFNCVALNDLMAQRHKWTLQNIMNPLSSHLVITDANVGQWREFTPALVDCIAYLAKHPNENNRGDAVLYGMSEKIPDKSVVGTFLIYYLEAVLDAL
jgi:sphinganine-1-phosphate aldolase